jgi:hypothetical protein
MFRAGAVLLSLRNLNTLLVADQRTWRVKWAMTGPFLGQHDPDFLPNERGSVRLLGREKRWGVWSTSEGRGRSVFGGPEPRLPTWPVGCCALASGDVP